MELQTVFKGDSINVQIPELFSTSPRYWFFEGTALVHDSVVPGYVNKQYDFLEIGKQYRVTYTAEHNDCSFRVGLGDQNGQIRNSSGTFSEDFTLSGNKILNFWSNGGVKITNIMIDELAYVDKDEIVDIDNQELIENKSFTLSYYPQGKQWISFHSYLPNNYITHYKSLLVKNNKSQIKLFNTGDYGTYLTNQIRSSIIEVVFNDSPLDTKVFDNLTINLKSESNGASTNKFFDSVILNTEYQCSGTISLDLTNLTKKERNWTINKFRDITNNTNNSMFSTLWSDIQTEYPIDKVINSNKIDNLKPWYQRGRFRDKFLKVRFTENNLENQKIICTFVSTVIRPSTR